MLLILLAVLVAWTALVAVVIGMCVAAARSDHEQARSRRLDGRRVRLSVVA